MKYTWEDTDDYRTAAAVAAVAVVPPLSHRMHDGRRCSTLEQKEKEKLYGFWSTSTTTTQRKMLECDGNNILMVYI